MPVSQLKRLKAQVHEQRQARQKGRTIQAGPPPKKTDKNKKQPPKETPQQRSNALRTETLLPELQRRNKVGGIIDRRIGENDPTLAPEERAARRFMAESQRQKKRSVFNLEEVDDDDEEEGILTHGGKKLDGRHRGADMLGDMLDDYEGSEDDNGSVDGEDKAARRERKRKRFQEELEEAMEQRELEPDRKKTKQEVMKEVIAKSKLHKYERQQAKEDDEDARLALDKELPDLLAALRGTRVKPRAQAEKENQAPILNGGVHPDRLAQMNGTTKEVTEKEYDQRLRQMAMDKRAQPTERTKTDEEKAAEKAERLQELEAKRLRRMNGEPVSSDEEDEEAEKDPRDLDGDMDFEQEQADEAAEFGLRAAKAAHSAVPDVEDEDDFIIDDDLVASGSDIDMDSEDSSDDNSAEDEAADEADDADFLQDLLPNNTTKDVPSSSASGKGLAYTYPCPQTHEDFLAITKDVLPLEIPTIVQRIRALYHPQLHAGNKDKLATFAAVLVEHVGHMAAQDGHLVVIESLIRHIHSLSKTHGDEVARAFRLQLAKIQESGSIEKGELVILTAIGSIYPTSDHFHQVVTPAITLISKWLAITRPTSLPSSLNGAYLVALGIQYQRLSKRYIPELVRFTVAALESDVTLVDQELTTQHIQNLSAMMDLWSDKSAFIEIFSPVASAALSQSTLSRVSPQVTRQTVQKLKIMLNQAQLRRRPLKLHHHRPLPIKTSIPKFEESFNPGGHYEPDREKAEAAKLRKEYKREKKGAMRELRRDAEFVARTQLREKKEADRAYEEKQRRIIGEIQREEGREKNEYEREKRRRKGRS